MVVKGRVGVQISVYGLAVPWFEPPICVNDRNT